MPNPNPAYMDGAYEYGTAVLTITPKDTQQQQWAATCDDDFTVNRSSQRIEVRNQFGEAVGAYGIPTTPTGRTNIILPSGKRASIGDTFTADVTGTTVWIITDVTDPYEVTGYRKQQIEFAKKLSS